LFARPLFLAAFSALALTAATAAQAFTFEDGGADAKKDDNSMFYNSGKDDPMTSRFDDGSKKTIAKQGNSSIYFGGQGQNFQQRNDPGQYFSPNTLMGK